MTDESGCRVLRNAQWLLNGKLIVLKLVQCILYCMNGIGRILANENTGEKKIRTSMSLQAGGPTDDERFAFATGHAMEAEDWLRRDGLIFGRVLQTGTAMEA